AGFRPGRVGSTRFAVFDRLQFFPALAARAGNNAFLQREQVILALERGAGAVRADDPDDRRVTFAFDRFQFAPVVDPPFHGAGEVGGGDRFDFAARGRVCGNRDRRLGDGDNSQRGAAGNASDVFDLFGRRGVIGADEREARVDRAFEPVVV